MNSEEIHQIEPNGPQDIDRRKVNVMYKPRQEGNRFIFDDDSQFMRRSDGSLIRITDKKKS